MSICGDVLLSGGWRGYQILHARSLHDGHVLWSDTVGTFAGAHWSPRVVSAGVVTGIVGSRSVWLIDAASGRALQHWRLREPVLAESDEPSPVVEIDSHTMMIRCGARQVVTLHLSGQMEEVWEHPTDLSGVPAHLSNGRLWLTELRRTRAALVDLAAQRLIAVVPADVTVHSISAVKDGVVIADSSGLLHFRDADGELIATHRARPHLSDARGLDSHAILFIARSHLHALTIDASP
jgi:outer membrane protein assembly factor BamB